jgi:hypothetical protein
VGVKRGKQPISVTHPDLAKQADGWDPDEFTAHSHNKVSWKCTCGHTWERVIRDRARNQKSIEGADCPRCNSLARKFPEIAREAYGWDPNEFSAKSGLKLEWKCSVGHIYASQISNRTNGSNCPVCIGRKILPGFNDLRTTHPDIASELVNENPTNVSKGTKKKFEWKCRKGHIFLATVYNRTAGYGCPYCSGNKVLDGFNDLKTTHPVIAQELQDVDPRTISMGTHRKLKWKCSKGHIYLNTVNARTSQNQNCPFCSGKQVLAGFNDIATTHPELASQIYEGNAEHVTRGSKQVFTWRCELGHMYKVSIGERAGKNRGCPYCAGKKVLSGFNDLLTTHPELAGELVGSEGNKVSKGSGKKLEWKCLLGHEYVATVASRTLGSGCPICAGDKVLAGFNDLETTHPAIAAELLNGDPREVSKGMDKSFLWACPTGHSYSAPVKNRVSNQNCPYCAGKAVLKGFNDLATTHPEIASELIDGDPTKISKGSVKSYKWKCSLGHIYASKVNTRTTGPSCPYCSGNKVLEGFNDLLTTFPEIAKELVDVDPRTISRGSIRKCKWKCEFGHTWTTSPNSRTNHATPSGCPTCTIYGYDPNKDGWLYFMEHESFGYLQIGITNFPEDRLKHHRKFGWELLQLRGPMDGQLTANWETSILRMLRAKNAQMGPGKSDMDKISKADSKAFVGTEMWLRASFQANSINELMRLTEEFEADN